MTKSSDVTMAELARMAGVSVSTVSRALAGSKLIAKGTREAVEQLALQHGFEPNQAARNLRTRRTGTIAVVLPLGHQVDQHLTDPFLMTMIGCLADELTECGFDMLLRRVVPADDRWLASLVAARRADGMIVLGQSDQHHVLNAVAADYLNMVVWGAHLPDSRYLTVGSDNYRGGQMAADYLLGQGRRHLLVLGHDDVPEFRLREEGFRAFCQERHVSVQSRKVDLVPDLLMRQLPQHLAELGDLDGIFACSDVIANCTIAVLEGLGRRVPADVGIIGYDRVPLTGLGLSLPATLDQQLSRGARLLVELLLRRLAGEEVASCLLEPKLHTSGELNRLWSSSTLST